MEQLGEDLRRILGEVLDLPPIGDAEAVRWIMELKALPDPTPARLQLIAELEAAWHQAAAPDMARRRQASVGGQC